MADSLLWLCGGIYTADRKAGHTDLCSTQANTDVYTVYPEHIPIIVWFSAELNWTLVHICILIFYEYKSLLLLEVHVFKDICYAEEHAIRHHNLQITRTQQQFNIVIKEVMPRYYLYIY